MIPWSYVEPLNIVKLHEHAVAEISNGCHNHFVGPLTFDTHPDYSAYMDLLQLQTRNITKWSRSKTISSNVPTPSHFSASVTILDKAPIQSDIALLSQNVVRPVRETFLGSNAEKPSEPRRERAKSRMPLVSFKAEVVNNVLKGSRPVEALDIERLAQDGLFAKASSRFSSATLKDICLQQAGLRSNILTWTSFHFIMRRYLSKVPISGI